MEFDILSSGLNARLANRVSISMILVDGSSKTVSTSIDGTLVRQILTLSLNANRSLFGKPQSTFQKVCISLNEDGDQLGFEGLCQSTVPTVQLDYSRPSIKLDAVDHGYWVSYTAPSSPMYSFVELWELKSNDSTSMPQVLISTPDGSPISFSKIYFGNDSPVKLVSSDSSGRWVIVRFGSIFGQFTAFSQPLYVTPIDPIAAAFQASMTAPREVSVTGSSWRGDDLLINVTMPDIPINGVQISKLKISLISPDGHQGVVYMDPDPAKPSFILTITRDMVFGQFGELYSSFVGNIKTLNFNGIQSSGTNFVSAKRPNPFSAIANEVPTGFVLPTPYGYFINPTKSSQDTSAYSIIFQSDSPLKPVDVPSQARQVSASSSPVNLSCKQVQPAYFYFQYTNDFKDLSLVSDPILAECINAASIESSFPTLQLQLSKMNSSSIPLVFFSSSKDTDYVIKIGSPGSTTITTKVILIPANQLSSGGVFTTTYLLTGLFANTTYSISLGRANSKDVLTDELIFSFITYK